MFYPREIEACDAARIGFPGTVSAELLHMNSRWVSAVVSFAVVIIIGMSARGAEVVRNPAPAAGPADPALRMYYLGSVGHVGEFPGRVVQMSCDAAVAPQANEQCLNGLRSALETPDGSVHPLVPGTDRVARSLQSARLHGRKVRVFGRVYTNSGSILAGVVRPEHGG